MKVCFNGSRSEVRSLAFAAKAATNSTFSLDSENCVIESSMRSMGNPKFNALRSLFGQFVGSDQTFTIKYTDDVVSRQAPFNILLGRDIEGIAYRTGSAVGKCDGGLSSFMMEQIFAHEMIHHEPELTGKPLPAGGVAEENRAMSRGDNVFNAAVGRRLRCAH